MIRRAFLTLSLVVGLLCASQAQIMMLFSSDSLTNITSPLDLDSLFYWFAADQGVTDSLGGAIANDEGVGTWNDLSGNGHHVTQATNGARPVWKATGGPGGYPAIQFDGSNDFLSSSAHFGGSDDLTVFVVMKHANAANTATEFVLARIETSSNDRQWYMIGSNSGASLSRNFRVYKDGTSTNYNDLSYGVKSAVFQLHAITSNGAGTYSIFVDGSTASPSATTGGSGDWTVKDSATPGFSVGCINSLGTPTAFLQGLISEIIVYSRALSSTERAAIENYLNRKYDLYAAAESERDELLNGPKTPSKILTAYETLRKVDAYRCALNDIDRKEIEEYLNKKYTLYYFIIIGFPLASARRRKFIHHEKKNAA